MEGNLELFRINMPHEMEAGTEMLSTLGEQQMSWFLRGHQPGREKPNMVPFPGAHVAPCHFLKAQLEENSRSLS